MARKLEVDPQSLAVITFTWTEDKRPRTATVQLTAEGIDLDRVLDLLVAGFESSTDPVYTATAGEVIERVVRVRRPPAPKPDRPGKPIIGTLPEHDQVRPVNPGPPGKPIVGPLPETPSNPGGAPMLPAPRRPDPRGLDAAPDAAAKQQAAGEAGQQ